MSTFQGLRNWAISLAIALIVPVLATTPASIASSFTPRNGICELVAFEGAGLPDDPYLIETADQFAEMADCGSATSTSYAMYTGNPDTRVPLFALAQNIDMSAQPSTPLVRPGANFNAQETKIWLDGKGYEVSNIQISSSSGNVGLFAQLVGSSISNVVLSGEASSTGGLTVGLLAGFARESTFSNIVARVSVSGDVSTRAVGGLLGRSRGNTIMKVWVSPLSEHATVSSAHDGSASSFEDGVGGIVGGNYPMNYSRPWFIRESISTVNVSALSGNPAGGIIGRSSGDYPFDLSSTHYSGRVHSSHFAGGLVGRVSSVTNSWTIESSSSDAEISGGGFLGGLIGLVRGTSTSSVQILDSIATGTVSSTLDKVGLAGGIVGGTTSFFGGITIKGSFFEGDLAAVANSGTVKVGGVLGYAELFVIESTGARGSLVTTGGSNAYAGGLSGDMIYKAGGTSLNESYASVSISPNLIEGSQRAGGFVGLSTQLGFGTFTGNYFDSTLSGTAKPSLATYTPPLAGAIDTFNSSAFTGWTIDEFANRQATSAKWVMCESPIPSKVAAPMSCPLTARFARLGPDGRSLTVWMNGQISVLPSPDSFTVGGTSVGQSIATVSDSVISITLSSAVLSGTNPLLSYVKPAQSPLLSSKQYSPEAPSFGSFEVMNGSVLNGPSVTNLTVDNLAATSFDISFQCGGSCDPTASFTYAASITPDGGATTNSTSTSPTNTATVQFGNLSSNVNHVVTVTVTQGGITSPVATITVQTPRPIATISALAIADTSATLTVGCSNCGAAPSSFTVSATPVLGGGAAITSNTSVITGLTSETTYSFSVVVAFAGTTSNSVLWQGNPVGTLPFVPVISNVSPSLLPLGGGQVTVTGANFSTSNQLSLRGVTLSFTIVNGTTITFAAPSDGAGSYDLAIRNPVGTYTLSSAITYVLAPTLSTNSPILGTTNGGTIVTLTGANLMGASRVNLGTTTVSFTVISDSKIRFTTPATSASVVDIGVVTAGGSATLSNGIEFTSSALVPIVTSITPATGPIAGGTSITVTGLYFSGSYSDLVSAAIGGVSGSSVLIVDDSTLVFITPAGQGTTLAVSVATGAGTGSLAGAFSYISPAPEASSPETSSPTIDTSTSSAAPPRPSPIALVERFSTRSITVDGGQITIFGFQLARLEFASLANQQLKIVSNSSRQVTLLIGATETGVWNIVLRGPLGTTTIFRAITVAGVGEKP
jgi:hypothetical protein